MFLRIFLSLLIGAAAAVAEGVDTVETVNGPRATGYLGLGDMPKAQYESPAVTDGELPASFDWRDVPGVLSPIRDQGSCGSCYSFAITASLESAEVVQLGKATQNLSEQHIVSCARDSFGCGGGFMTTAGFAVKTGLTDEASFPYTGRNSRCKAGLDIKSKAVSYKLLGSPRKKPTVEEIKSALINKGPLFVTVMAGGSGWSGATGDVTSCRKRGSTNHMINLVGYDDKGWIIRNSWGERWGDKGYAHIGYGCDLIALEAGYLTVE